MAVTEVVESVENRSNIYIYIGSNFWANLVRYHYEDHGLGI